MTQEKKEELKNQLVSMVLIAKYARECNLYSHDLHFPNEEKDFQNNTFIGSPDIEFLKYIIRNILVLELSKLFGDRKNDKLSLYKLIKRFSKDGDFKNEELSVFCNNMFDTFITDKTSFLKDIYLLRDKVIAHSDFGLVETQHPIWDFLTTFHIFIDFSIDFIRKVYEKVFEEELPIDLESSFYKKTNFELLTIFKNHKREKC